MIDRKVKRLRKFEIGFDLKIVFKHCFSPLTRISSGFGVPDALTKTSTKDPMAHGAMPGGATVMKRGRTRKCRLTLK